jgi:hypothetical protein
MTGSIAPADADEVKATDGSAGVAILAGSTNGISLQGLSAGATTVYIVVEDASANLSEVLAIDIPAYAPTTIHSGGSVSNPLSNVLLLAGFLALAGVALVRGSVRRASDVSTDM